MHDSLPDSFPVMLNRVGTAMAFVIHYLYSFGIMALLSVLYGLSFRAQLPQSVIRFGLGLLFGGAAALAMSQTITLAPGVIVDPRNLFVGLSGAFLGIWGAVAALVGAFAMRISIGGAGMETGLVSMSIASAAGLFWGHFMHGRICQHARCLALLGAMISLSLAATILLPADAMWRVLTGAGPFVVFFNVLGVILFGSLMERERSNAVRMMQLRSEATTDPLTGLLNRRGFDKYIEALPSAVRMAPSAVLVLDLDHFKSVNDTFGHDVGDMVLSAVGRQLKEKVRKQDLVGRFGGEEFIILLTDTNERDAELIAERLRASIGDLGPLADGRLLPVTASLGGYWDHDGINLMLTVPLADRALYRAKMHGRNRMEFAPAADARLEAARVPA